MHTCYFVYDREASTPGNYVAICRGCGAVRNTPMRAAPPLFPTELPGIWELERWPGRRHTRPGLID